MRQIIVISALAFSLSVHAEVYKCPGPNGTVYQQRPCEGGATLEIEPGSSTTQGELKMLTPDTGLRPGEKELLQDIRDRERRDREAERRYELERARIEQRNKELCAEAKQKRSWAESKRDNSRYGRNYEADVERYSSAVKSYCR